MIKFEESRALLYRFFLVAFAYGTIVLRDQISFDLMRLLKWARWSVKEKINVQYHLDSSVESFAEK